MPNAIDDVFNVRAGRYFIARAIGTCVRCDQQSRLIAVGLPPGHEVLELAGPDDDAPDADADADAEDDADTGADAGADDANDRGDDDLRHAGAADTWATVNHAALLFQVAQLSGRIRARMCAMSQAYRKRAEPGGDSCWANHCDHCGAPFDDQDLFCEPGGAFLPVSAADARRIQLISVEEVMAADAAGYAEDPEFFDSMRRA